MNEEKIDVVDEKYSYKEELSIKEIILRHIRKMSDLSCQELTPSYWQERPIKVGEGIMITKIYHEDLREAFINATDFLFWLINPYIEKDKKGNFEKELKEIEKDTDDKFKSDKYKNQNEWIQQKLEIKKHLFSEIMLFLNRIKFFISEEFKE